MYRTEGVLALLALYLGVAQSFSWDIVVGGNKQLDFYDSNGTKTHTEDIPAANYISSLAYDPVHNCVLFAHHHYGEIYYIYSFNIATRKIIMLVRGEMPVSYLRIAYDPITSLLFWTETGPRSRNSMFSKGSRNKGDQNLLIKFGGEYDYIWGITVDSCKGYIYWRTSGVPFMERARFDGSERQVVISEYNRFIGGITVDHHTQKIYFLNSVYYNPSAMYDIDIISTDLNGKNIKILYTEKNPYYGGTMAVSKDFIYWRTNNTFSQITRNPPLDKQVQVKQFLLADPSDSMAMASNYKITNDCTSLNVSTDVSLLCVHGTKVSGESRCECTQGYIGVRCEVSVCNNYCFQGDCSVSAEGQPKCRCKPGYSGKRCEVNACHEYCSNNGVCVLNEASEPFCQCTSGYEGERCNVSVCQNYCFQGDCSVSAEGQPKCRCNAGYCGERCEVNAFSTPTIVAGAASCSTAIQELNNTLKGWRIDMDHAIAKLPDDIIGTLLGLREEMEISIMYKLNGSIKCTLSDMKQEMNTLRSELEKLKENDCTVAHDVSGLKSSAELQTAEQKELQKRVDFIFPKP